MIIMIIMSITIIIHFSILCCKRIWPRVISRTYQIAFLLMQDPSGAQLWYENNFLLCEASVNLGITKCKISSQYGPETTHFCRGWAGRGEGVEIIRFAYRFHSLHPEYSYSHTSDECATQQRQKIIEQIYRYKQWKGLTDFTRGFFKGTTSYDLLTRLSSCQIRILILLIPIVS